MSQPNRYWPTVNKPAIVTNVPHNCATRRLKPDFGAVRHSHRDTPANTKQKAAAGLIIMRSGARLFSKPRPKTHVANVRPPISVTERLMTGGANLSAWISR